MSFLTITRETWTDLTVNLIPMAVLLLLDGLFWIVNPWGVDPFAVGLMHVLTLFPMLALGLLTYVSGRVIQRDEGAAADAEAVAN